MKTELLELLRCPKTGQCLTLETEFNTSQEVKAGWLFSEMYCVAMLSTTAFRASCQSPTMPITLGCSGTIFVRPNWTASQA
jgi:hypothetical protein